MKAKLSVLALALSQCYAHANSEPLFSAKPFYGPGLNLSADYQNKANSFGYFDGFLPVSGNNDTIWFTDVRFLNRERGRSLGSVGLGHRHQLGTHPWLVGAYGFIHRRLSPDSHFFYSSFFRQ